MGGSRRKAAKSTEYEIKSKRHSLGSSDGWEKLMLMQGSVSKEEKPRPDISKNIYRHV
jgi:hypothetical protein